MINYLTSWNYTAGMALEDGNLALWAWSVGALVAPFAGVLVTLAGLVYGAFKLWEDNYL